MELTGNVQGLIDLVGGGGGSTVEVTPILTSGEHIADIEVDGVTSELYAPEPTEPTEVEVTPIVTSGEHIADIEVNGVTSELYAPSVAKINYSTTPQRTGRKWIDDCDVWEAVFVFTLTSAAQTIDLSNFHIKDLISIRGTINGSETSTNGYQMPFPFYLDNTYFAMFTKKADNNALVETSNYMIESYNIVKCIIEFTTT